MAVSQNPCIDDGHRADFVGDLVGVASGQGDLIVTLSVASIGGMLALVIQILLHNHSSEARVIYLSWASLFLASICSFGVSILAGYLYLGGLFNNLPVFYTMSIDCTVGLMKQGSNTIDALRKMSTVQFVSFFFGIVLAVVFFLLNARTASRPWK